MLQALAAQVSLELPGVTVLSKCDLMADREKLDRFIDYFDQDEDDLPGDEPLGPLGKAIKQVLDNNQLVTLR